VPKWHDRPAGVPFFDNRWPPAPVVVAKSIRNETACVFSRFGD
jgi:hypothetical protein